MKFDHVNEEALYTALPMVVYMETIEGVVIDASLQDGRILTGSHYSGEKRANVIFESNYEQACHRMKPFIKKLLSSGKPFLSDIKNGKTTHKIMWEIKKPSNI